jgi:hypothetical protein
MRRRVNLRFVIVIALLATTCGRGAEPPEEEELPTLDVTRWTDKTELFMEYPPLVVRPSFSRAMSRRGPVSFASKGHSRRPAATGGR